MKTIISEPEGWISIGCKPPVKNEKGLFSFNFHNLSSSFDLVMKEGEINSDPSFVLGGPKSIIGLSSGR